jgi:hybrid cluster-associated redox disulfide protein
VFKFLKYLLYNEFNYNHQKDNIRSEKMANKITQEMNILEIVQNYPESLEIFAKYGLGCIGCAAARFENLEAGAKVHGFDPDEMVAEINKLIS